MVARVGRVEAVDEALVSPLRREPCVHYFTEVIDVATRHPLASERHAVPFVIVGQSGERTAVVSTHASLDGFIALDRTCRVDEAGPAVLQFLEAKGVHLPRESRVRIVERRIVVGERLAATGALRVAPVGSADPYRTAASTLDALEPTGLALRDLARGRTGERNWAIGAAAVAFLAFAAFQRFHPSNEYRSQSDCPAGTKFDPDFHEGDLCGNPANHRRWTRQQHGATTTSKGGICVGKHVTYYAPSEEPR